MAESSNMQSNTNAAKMLCNHDGSPMLDEQGRPIYRSQFLSTNPLRSDCKERMEGNRVLTYITGDGVIRTMNTAFGNAGWSTEITRERQVDCEFQKGKWIVSYMATVKVSLLDGSGASHEDVGCGEGEHASKLKALDIAVKSAVTDAMKRACRHYGERLGNALYIYGNGMNKAPKDNKTALRDLEEREASDLFGNQALLSDIQATRNSQEAATAAATASNQVAGNKQPPPNQTPHVPAPVTTTLERQTTPPTVAAATMAAGSNKETSPSQLGHGFTRASELASGMVTPATASPPQGMNTAGSPAISLGSNASPAAHPFGPLHTQPSTQQQHQQQHSPPSNTNPAANPPKRQKVVHNPYQH